MLLIRTSSIPHTTVRALLTLQIAEGYPRSDGHNITKPNTMTRVQITLLVEVDTEDDINCPDGDAINQNVVVNAVDNGFFLDPVTVLDARIV